MTDDLKAELEAQRRSRALSADLRSLVERSPMIPEPAIRRATLHWLQDQTPEERAIFAGMLEGVETRADAAEADDALADEAIAEWVAEHASHRYFMPEGT